MLFPARLPIDDQHLTTREAEVLWCCTEGLTSCQTAEKLFISPKTVNNHHYNIGKRFGLTGHAGLLLFGVRIRDILEPYTKIPPPPPPKPAKKQRFRGRKLTSSQHNRELSL